MRERWGTFSVRDHINDAPFVSDVLLYDRLVIPIPDPSDSLAEQHWIDEKWRPKLLHKCLDVLKIKTEEEDGLVLTVPWGSSKEERFKSKMSVAAALATQGRCPEQGYYVDPFHMTRTLLKDDFCPALPNGVSKAWTVAAYPSADAFRRDVSVSDVGRRTRLAAVMRHHFLSPATSDPDQEMLKRAVDLVMKDSFRRKRSSFYEWQEEIIEENISDKKAIEELEQRLSTYNTAIKKAFRDTVAKYAFTVIPIAIGITAAAIAGATTGMVVAGASGIIQLTRFWKFDRKPIIANGDLDAAAMVHDAREVLSLD
jgi:hypothetical protein